MDGIVDWIHLAQDRAPWRAFCKWFWTFMFHKRRV